MNNIKEIIFTYIDDDNQTEHTIKLDNFINQKDPDLNVARNESNEYIYKDGCYRMVNKIILNNLIINLSLKCEGFDIKEVKNDN